MGFFLFFSRKRFGARGNSLVGSDLDAGSDSDSGSNSNSIALQIDLLKPGKSDFGACPDSTLQALLQAAEGPAELSASSSREPGHGSLPGSLKRRMGPARRAKEKASTSTLQPPPVKKRKRQGNSSLPSLPLQPRPVKWAQQSELGLLDYRLEI